MIEGSAFGLKPSERIQYVYKRIKAKMESPRTVPFQKNHGESEFKRNKEDISEPTSLEAILSKGRTRRLAREEPLVLLENEVQQPIEESTDSSDNETLQSTEESNVPLEESTPNYYCMTEQCKADIKNEFEKNINEQPGPQSIVGILKKIFEEPFRNSLEGNDKSLIGKTVHLPKIFPHEMNYSNERFKFRDFSLSVVITEDLLRLIERFIRGIKKPLSIEGPSGIGKSFMLYFLVCFLLASDDYWIAYLPLPRKTTKIVEAEIVQFSCFYYPDIIEHFDHFNFESGFEYGMINTLDYKQNGENRKFVLIIDQFNNLVSTYQKNENFINSILFENCFPRLIVNRTVDNDLDWERAIPKFYKLKTTFTCNPRQSKKVATIMLRILLIERGFVLDEMIKLYWNHFVQQVLAITSCVSLQLQSLVEKLFEFSKKKLETLISCEPNRFDEFCRNLESVLFKFKNEQSVQIERELTQFSKSAWIEKNREAFEESINAIIYGASLKRLNPQTFDKRYFYMPQVNIGYRILPIYDEAMFIAWKNYLPKTIQEADTMMNTFIKSNVRDPAVIGKLLKVYYWKFSQIQNKIVFSSNCVVQLDNVEMFNYQPEINFSCNTLFVPTLYKYPMYDFVVVAGKGSETARIIFVQFTIQKDCASKCSKISKKFKILKKVALLTSLAQLIRG